MKQKEQKNISRRKTCSSYTSDVTVQGMVEVILHLLPFSGSDRRRLGTCKLLACEGLDVKSELISSCPVTQSPSAPLISLRRLAERSSPMMHLFFPRGSAAMMNGGSENGFVDVK